MACGGILRTVRRRVGRPMETALCHGRTQPFFANPIRCGIVRIAPQAALYGDRSSCDMTHTWLSVCPDRCFQCGTHRILLWHGYH